MKKIALLAFVFLLIFPLIIPVGASSTMWSQTYGGTNYDIAQSVVQTSDGSYAIVGSTGSFGAGYSDFWLVKTDSLGNMQWNKTYGGAGEDVPYSVIQTSDGGYAIAGTKLVKTDSAGNVQWNQTYGGTQDQVYSLIQTSDGGYALAGVTSLGDFWLVKTDEAGVIPEFPTWTSTLLILIVLTVAIAIYKRRQLKTPIH